MLTDDYEEFTESQLKISKALCDKYFQPHLCFAQLA